jgi:hypothetical protein
LGLRGKETSDGLLSSEDLNEEKVITTPLTSISLAFARRVVEDNIEKRTVDFQPTVVMNETQLPESVHRLISSRVCKRKHSPTPTRGYIGKQARMWVAMLFVSDPRMYWKVVT